ncbi:unnamed protein product [Lymnaea stagnalis]|uniref:Amine oxidase n=1 Tax=Lymnaea stagnalis TaxID=6523 RepID=A0AAV2IGJ6_LYMST
MEVKNNIMLRVCIHIFIMWCGVHSAIRRQSSEHSDATMSVCGEQDPNGNVRDLSEPAVPGPFHDLTREELIAVRTFLEEHPEIQASSPDLVTVNSSFVYMADLFVAKKSDVISYLDKGAKQPIRQARVIVFRGDLGPPVVQEYICGPLPKIESCDLMKHSNRRNPVQFSLRPFSKVEFDAIAKRFLAELDTKMGHILIESYNATFTRCRTVKDCLDYSILPLGTGIAGDINKRRLWIAPSYDIPFYTMHPLDFLILFNLEGADDSEWRIDRLSYAGQMYDSVDQLVSFYDANRIPKIKLRKPTVDNNLFSTLYRRGDPLPPKPQRPPLQVEPDGKRYTTKDRKVEYMGWSFHYRMSSLTGPSLYDVRFKGQRIVYEMGLSEISVFYSGNAPLTRSVNYVDSASIMGIHSKTMVPGADCPEFSTLINQTFLSHSSQEPGVAESVFCLFEINNGYPLRRHASYEQAEGAYYSGMLDSALTLRSALTIDNYDYVIDFIFHQNGIIETKFMSTGHILTSFYHEAERNYGFRLHDNIAGSVHYHMAHFKVDLDIAGTSNRYQTLDVVEEEVLLDLDPCTRYHQTKIIPRVIRTEKEAVYDYNFNTPKYLLVYNEANKTEYGVNRAYRLQMNGMSKQMIPKGLGNEPTISWARHQLVVTKQKDEEISASSNYGMFDGANPVVDFSQYYMDNDNIVDEDLVFWITAGMHHIPHTEDFPVTPTVGNHLTFFLLPYNFFPGCPSMGSRDAMYIKFKNSSEPSQGIFLDRNGNSRDQCLTPRPTLEEDIEENPNLVLDV